MVDMCHKMPLCMLLNMKTCHVTTFSSWAVCCRVSDGSLFLMQTLLANGLVAPNAVSGLIAALAAPEMPRQQPPAPAVLTDPELAAALSYQAPAQQVPDRSEHHPLTETCPVCCKPLKAPCQYTCLESCLSNVSSVQ